MTKFIVLQICALLAVIALGLVSLSQVETLKAEKATLVAERVAQESALAAQSSDAYYQGAYAACRTFAEGLFAVPTESAVRQCNDMVRQARDYGLVENEFWNGGYE